MSTFAPVVTLEELDALDDDEMLEGYRSGLDGDDEPGNNHSKAFWHGWSNGARDRGRLPYCPTQAALVKAWVARERLRVRAA